MLFVDKHAFFCFYINSKGENPKRRRMRKKSASNSKILKYILTSLKLEKHQHQLSWENENMGIFKIKFVHKNNPKWNQASVDLFLALDKISEKRYAKYSQSTKLLEESKTRCRANLKKLCESGALLFIGELKSKDKAKEKIYRITDKWALESKCGMKETNSEMNINAKEEKLKEESKVSIIVPVEIPSKEISHYLCLSNQVFPLRSDIFSISALHQENVLGMLQELISSTGSSESVICQSKVLLTDIGNVQDTDMWQSDVFDDQSVQQSATNVLNDTIVENLNVMQIDDEYTCEESTANFVNMFAQTVSVPDTEISAIPQYVIQNESAPNTDVIMHPSLLQANMAYCEQRFSDSWNQCSQNEADYTELKNLEPSSSDESIDFMSYENEPGFPMKNLENPLWCSTCQ